jgi:hypothetical protein
MSVLLLLHVLAPGASILVVEAKLREFRTNIS